MFLIKYLKYICNFIVQFLFPKNIENCHPNIYTKDCKDVCQASNINNQTENVTSESNEVVPERNEVVPESNEVVPESNEVVPESNEVVIENNEVVPESNEVVPESNEVVPNDRNKYQVLNVSKPMEPKKFHKYIVTYIPNEKLF